uniref:Bromodomain adjacent to zinc finger domain protein 1A n=1 Tax=Culex tarsalis TaxID=7177 RepID=A0A1Q3F0Y3_CULTA
MPLLRRKLFEKVTEPERLRDSDEVFYCETTNEIFSNYEDYFHRVMLISSIVWSCSITGKPNLTYAEALESEKQARRLLRTFPAAVKGPFLMVASKTKRSSFNEMLEDVFGFIKDHYFEQEVVDALEPSGRRYREATIVEVIPPSSTTKSSPVKAEKIRYRVQSEDGLKPREWTVISENLKRDRSATTRDKCKLFLKQHVEQVGGVLRIKEASFKKFVTDEKLKEQQVFFGKPPDFEQSKRLKQAEEKKMRLEQEKKNASPPKSGSAKKRGPKPGQKKDDKQQSISKYLNKSTEDGAKTDKKVSNKDSKDLKEEMERVRKEKEEKEALEKKQQEEQKAILNELALVALKKYNRIGEDQELIDHKVIPKPKPVKTLIGTRHFSDFMYVLEFVTSFAELLSIKDKFANGLTMDLLERALLLKEVNGPLSDIFQVLLSTIFSHQIEEENEVAVRYDPSGDVGTRKAFTSVLKQATKAAVWCETHYCTKLSELPMDSTTISELLRLHFLASGALIEEKGARWRYAMRGGYHSCDDPGMQLVLDYPHIFRALKSYTVFSLPVGDILKILKCLIDQLLTYSSVRELVEERLEKARTARLQYNSVNVAKRKREARVISEKWDMRNDIKKKVTAHEGTVEQKLALRKELEEKMAQDVVKMDAEAERDIKVLQKDIDKFKESFFDYQIYLGTDRAYRSYWLFESLPGLFVEHDRTYSGKCADVPMPNFPELAGCPDDRRKKLITQAITNGAGGKELKVTQEDGAIGKMMLSGFAKLKLKKPAANGGEGDPLAMSDLVTPSNEELFMCTANPKACPIHTDNFPGSVRWGYYNTEEEINALIESLNTRGTRERALRENLESEKELILTHISSCPVDKLSVEASEQDAILAAIVNKSSRKYEAPNFNHEPGTDPNLILETTLRENVLELESKITVGYLGAMKVADRDEWRIALEQFEYKQLSEPLRWGPNRVMALKDPKDEQQDQDQDQDDEGMEDDASDTDNDKLLSHEKDPGYNLPDTMIIESEDSSDEAILLHDSVTLHEKVHSLAKALLQIEQCVDAKFLIYPFGPKKNIKDKANITKQTYKGQRNLAAWEESLMRATNFSQIFLHYNVLYDAIQWSRSAEKIACMICRRKGDPSQTLLCDDCNRACHMYCLKPKLKQVPEGDWFCQRCRPEDYTKKKQTKKRKVFEEEEEEEVLDETIADKDSDDDESESEEEIICKKCKSEGATAICHTCGTGYHPECTKSLDRTPKKRWNCDKCSKASSKAQKKKKTKESSKKAKKRSVPVRLAVKPLEFGSDEEEDDVVDEQDEEDMDVTEEIETSTTNGNSSRRRSTKRQASEEASDDDESLATKAKRSRQSSSKRSLTNGHHTEEEQLETSRSKPSSRRSTANNVSASADEIEPARRGRRTGDDMPLNNIALYTLLEDVLKHEDSWPFRRPVSTKEVPDYYDIIKSPMDFAKVKSKLNMGEYTINEQMMNDVQLVFRNCDLYNTDETEIYHAGRSLEQFVVQRTSELGLPFKPSDMLKNSGSLEKNGKSSQPDTSAVLNGNSPKAAEAANSQEGSASKRRSIRK